MAWTETCKIDFVKQIEHKKEQGISVRQALKQLSEESDIPIGTLSNWMYPEQTKARSERQRESVRKNANVFDGLSIDEKTKIVKEAETQIRNRKGLAISCFNTTRIYLE
ncbi:hypothetical protein KAX02_02835 [candidate division WOR-3 bacterium]|nr:hypothetical protein [candidate division WOR-3 bacterium]